MEVAILWKKIEPCSWCRQKKLATMPEAVTTEQRMMPEQTIVEEEMNWLGTTHYWGLQMIRRSFVS